MWLETSNILAGNLYNTPHLHGHWQVTADYRPLTMTSDHWPATTDHWLVTNDSDWYKLTDSKRLSLTCAFLMPAISTSFLTDFIRAIGLRSVSCLSCAQEHCKTTSIMILKRQHKVLLIIITANGTVKLAESGQKISILCLKLVQHGPHLVRKVKDRYFKQY